MSIMSSSSLTVRRRSSSLRYSWMRQCSIRLLLLGIFIVNNNNNGVNIIMFVSAGTTATKTTDCGCPDTCNDSAKLQKGHNGAMFDCGTRLAWLMNKKGHSAMEACELASQYPGMPTSEIKLRSCGYEACHPKGCGGGSNKATAAAASLTSSTTTTPTENNNNNNNNKVTTTSDSLSLPPPLSASSSKVMTYATYTGSLALLGLILESCYSKWMRKKCDKDGTTTTSTLSSRGGQNNNNNKTKGSKKQQQRVSNITRRRK